MFNELLAVLGNKKAIRRQCAKRVKAAFDGVDWSQQSFIVPGIGTPDAGGEKHFYKATEIDAAIKRLNEVLTDLSR